VTFEKLAYAQQLLRASFEKQAGLDQAVAGAAKAVGRGVGGPLKWAGKKYWNAAGRAADSAFTQGSNAHKLLKPAAQVGIAGLGVAGLGAAAHQGVQTARANHIGFDPNVQGYMRQRLNPQYGYQEVFV
jgi:hypothetical protein